MNHDALVPRRGRTLAATTLALLIAACGGDDGEPVDDTDVADTDGSGGDVAADTTDADPDAGDESTPDTADEDAPDANADDATPDETVPDADDVTPDAEVADDVAPDVAQVECEDVPLPEPDPLDGEQRRFALTMFHYNIEYVIGGLEYFDEVLGRNRTFLNRPFNEGWDNDRVEDYIIRETLVPMLAMYAEHPTWRFTVEMQAYAIEIMAARHPDALALLRTLAQRGQAEVVSFHYAAQLFLAFPREDQERSLARTRAIFEEHCIPLSGVVFNQEGQAGEGRQQLLVDAGYTIGVFPRNLWRYVRPETPWPVYASEGGRLIVGPGAVDPASGIEVTWPFFDDGELRAVEDLRNPYFAPVAPHVPARVAEFEAQLAALEADGWKLATITDYVRQVEGMGVEVPEAPPVLDGTWQPPSTDSIHRWLGGRSQANIGDEEDNRLRSGNAVARMHADATQVLVEVAEAQGVDTSVWDDDLSRMWKALWHAQVSDGSGVNPWRAEVLWCLARNAEVLDRATTIRTRLLAELGWDHVRVDLADRTAEALTDLPTPEPPEPVEPWFDIETTGEGRTLDVAWYRVAGDDRARVIFTYSAATDCGRDCDEARIALAFPWDGTTLRYSPALIEDEVRSYPMADFTFLEDQAFLPLPNGLIGLGDDLWAIKHTRSAHIAARISPSDDHIRFIDAAILPTTSGTWEFELFRGSAEDALAIATGINIDPAVWY